jgi:hypothetical protein
MANIPATYIRAKPTKLSIVKLNPWMGPVSLVLVLVAITIVNSRLPKADWGLAWLGTVALVSLAVGIIGGSVNGRVEGVFIDSLNRMSLSRFQMVVWTVLVLSILVSASAFNLQWADPSKAAAEWRTLGVTPAPHRGWGPLDIDIPPELLFAMGIAAFSFVATPGLLSLKAAQSPQANALGATTTALGLSPADTSNSGRVFSNTQAGLARWSDMFRGDEVANADSPDLGKIQQFLITLLVVGIYAATAWSMFVALGDGSQTAVVRLPLVSSGLVTLMAISHASYLGYKYAPHVAATPSQAAAIPAAAATPAAAPPAADNAGG